MDVIGEWVRAAIGPEGDPTALTTPQMAVRAVIVYAVGLTLLRVGGNRILGRYAAIDIVVGIMLGAVLSRPVNGQAPLLPSIAASAAMVLVHRLLAGAACRWPGLARVVKGRPHAVMQGGRVLPEALRRNGLGLHDLEEALRLAGHRPGAHDVEEAYLERNGRVSFLRRQPAKTPPPDDGGPYG